MSSIPWYMTDPRFEPGTVADVGHSIRLRLSRHKVKSDDVWNLCMAIRTRAKDGVAETLKPKCRVATFKKCESLKGAQARAEVWFSEWRI